MRQNQKTRVYVLVSLFLGLTGCNMSGFQSPSSSDNNSLDVISLAVLPFTVNGVPANELTVEGSNEPIKLRLALTSQGGVGVPLTNFEETGLLSDPPPIPPNSDKSLNFDLKLRLVSFTGTLSQSDIIEDLSEITLPAGKSEIPLSYHAKQDSDQEGSEQATVVYEAVNANISESISFTLRVLDDDVTSIFFVKADSCRTLPEAEAATCRVDADRTGNLDVPLTVQLNYSGTASLNEDFTAPASLTFAAGQSHTQFSFKVINDSVYETTEDFTIKMIQAPDTSCFCDLGLSYSISDNDASPEGRSVEIKSVINLIKPSIGLDWSTDLDNAPYTVARRELGESAWDQEIGKVPTGERSFVDSNVVPGKTYEYKVERSNGKGFITVAYNLPPQHHRGRVFVIAEAGVAGQLSSEIELWKDQIAGDGWDVVYETISATAPVPVVKQRILSHYQEPASLKAVVLFGHVPVPYSGQIAPDGHGNHSGAWPADVYYGDMDGIWTDTIINNVTASREQNRNIPGDGKFDQSTMPSDAEIAVGRIDLWDMPAFAPLTEVDLLRRYLQKMTNYRTAQFTPTRRALIDDNFGDFNGEAFSRPAWNAFGSIVGREQTYSRDWFTELPTNDYLWAYGCGGGNYTGANGIGHTVDFAAQSVNAVFTALFGSYFGDWDSTDNFLRAPLAADGRALVSFWSGRPNWAFHSLASGEPLVTTVLATWNRAESYFFTGYGRMVHVSLMGDPTLRDFYLPQISGLNLANADATIRLSWADDSAEGYYIYKSANRHSGYQLVNTVPVTQTTFQFTPDTNDHFVMIKAVKTQETFGGIFQNLSTGVILAF